jgi:hypothetical protein
MEVVGESESTVYFSKEPQATPLGKKYTFYI